MQGQRYWITCSPREVTKPLGLWSGVYSKVKIGTNYSIGIVVHHTTVTFPVNSFSSTSSALEGGLLTTQPMRPYHSMSPNTQTKAHGASYWIQHSDTTANEAQSHTDASVLYNHIHSRHHWIITIFLVGAVYPAPTPTFYVTCSVSMFVQFSSVKVQSAQVKCSQEQSTQWTASITYKSKVSRGEGKRAEH